MRKPLIIFGTGDIAQLAYFYFNRELKYEVIAFTIDAEYRTEQLFCNLPVIAFEDLSKLYGPEKYEMFVALSYSQLNKVRKDKYLKAKELGYQMASFISSHATILNAGQIGDNCFILEDNTIQPFVEIGNNVSLWSGNHICHHSIIRDHCFISSHVVISGGVEIGEQCFIGVNTAIHDHVKVGEKCLIGAGALLSKDAAAEGVYNGVSSSRSKVPSSRLRGI